MTPERRERVWALFDEAAELPPAERSAFLDSACAGDAGLRAEVESLLACDADFPEGAGDADVLKSPVVRSPAPTLLGAGESPAAWPPGPSRRELSPQMTGSGNGALV